MKTPISIGARLMVKWHRENFSAVARNCRRDGREFLLGVRRDPTGWIAMTPEPDVNPPQLAAPSLEATRTEPKDAAVVRLASSPAKLEPAKPQASAPSADVKRAATALPSATAAAPDVSPAVASHAVDSPAIDSPTSNRQRSAVVRSPIPAQAPFPAQERKPMQPKSFFPKFWNRGRDVIEAPKEISGTESTMKALQPHAAETLTGSPTNLLSYDDIYHAAGILTPRSGYGVHKVVDMLSSDRIRELSKEVKRAAVLMALDAAGTPPDELLKDATHRQQALDSYEAGQQKQLEDFEARKAQENAKIQAELDRLTAHYAERIKQNQEQVLREKDALRNWQMAKQYESQRISEVMELCAKQPVSAVTEAPPAPNSAAVAASTPPKLASKASSGQ